MPRSHCVRWGSGSSKLGICAHPQAEPKLLEISEYGNIGVVCTAS